MSTLFSTSFTTPAFAEWTSVDSTRTEPYPTGGCSDGPSATCMCGSDNVPTQAVLIKCLLPSCGFGANPSYPFTSTGIEFAIYCPDPNTYIPNGDPTDPDAPEAPGLLMLDAITVAFYSGDTSGLFTGQVWIRRDGKLLLLMKGGGNPALGTAGNLFAPFYTSAGAIPFDGTNHAYVLTLDFNANNQTVVYTLEKDTVSLLTGTFAAGANYCQSKWGAPNPGTYIGGFTCPDNYHPLTGIGRVTCLVHRNPVCGTPNVLSKLSSVRVDTTHLTLTACSAPTLTAETCPVVFTDIAIDCESGQMTITGSNFPDDMVITLQGPSGINETFDVVSQSSTEVVIENLDPPFISGVEYCVTGPCI